MTMYRLNHIALIFLTSLFLNCLCCKRVEKDQHMLQISSVCPVCKLFIFLLDDGVMVIVAGNGHSHTSSNTGRD